MRTNTRILLTEILKDMRKLIKKERSKHDGVRMSAYLEGQQSIVDILTDYLNNES